MPQLSPTHTKARIIRFDVANGDEVTDYDPVFLVETSPDFVTPGYRDSPDQKVKIIIETQEEGVVKGLQTNSLGKWLEIHAELGVIDDGDPVDGDWTWQAYTTSSN